MARVFHKQLYYCIQDETIARCRDAMHQTRRRVEVAYRQAGSNFWMYIALFAVAIFVVVYVLSKLYRLGHLVLGG